MAFSIAARTTGYETINVELFGLDLPSHSHYRSVLLVDVVSVIGARRTRVSALTLARRERLATARVRDSQGLYGHFFVLYGNIHMSMQRESMLSSARTSQEMFHGKGPFFN